MFRDFKRDTIRYTGGILDNEAVVPTCIRVAATTLPYIFVEGFGRLCGPVPAGRPPPPPDRPVPTHATPFEIDDETTTKGESKEAVRRLRRNRSGGHTHLRAEHLQQCIREEYPSETSTAPLKPNRKIKLVEIIQFMWETRFIPTELGWNVLVLIPKVNADTRGIGLLEVVWKVVEAVIDTWIKSLVQFHNECTGFAQ